MAVDEDPSTRTGIVRNYKWQMRGCSAPIHLIYLYPELAEVPVWPLPAVQPPPAMTIALPVKPVRFPFRWALYVWNEPFQWDLQQSQWSVPCSGETGWDQRELCSGSQRHPSSGPVPRPAIQQPLRDTPVTSFLASTARPPAFNLQLGLPRQQLGHHGTKRTRGAPVHEGPGRERTQLRPLYWQQRGIPRFPCQPSLLAGWSWPRSILIQGPPPCSGKGKDSVLLNVIYFWKWRRDKLWLPSGAGKRDDMEGADVLSFGGRPSGRLAEDGGQRQSHRSD